MALREELAGRELAVLEGKVRPRAGTPEALYLRYGPVGSGNRPRTRAA